MVNTIIVSLIVYQTKHENNSCNEELPLGSKELFNGKLLFSFRGLLTYPFKNGFDHPQLLILAQSLSTILT